MTAKKKTPETRQPLILALETATSVSSVAIFAGPELLGNLEFFGQNRHARLLTPMVNTLLHDLELQPADLSAVAVSKGPGSYTGLRVGVSTAKGLCMALDIPLISVGSLDALASEVVPLATELGAQIVPMIDARRMEVYTATFDAQGQRLTEVEAVVVEENSFADLLESGKVIFTGNGAAKCREILQHPNAIILDHNLSTARGMGRNAWTKFQTSEFADLLTFEPFYLKEFVAIVSKNKLI
ncbi:MAG: tRNA (adenosine(37)-N6)-threonylcarbamoyltransferase complex dimerization subunit type 1 TsaB [Bacteroidia bacterium]|nr:tRNA (adenosine(37)-N6)-threonylcarbamoyltransferase complex dimerization subunit type 1 TsaB [Bacteroidia bacterium]